MMVSKFLRNLIGNRNTAPHTDVFCPVCNTEQDPTWMKFNGTENGDYFENYHCANCGCRFVADYMGPDETCGHVINSEYEISGNIRSMNLGPAVRRGSNVTLLREKHPGLKTFELCPECGSEVEIDAYCASKCPECGMRILPCSMCSEDQCNHCNECPHSEKRCR